VAIVVVTYNSQDCIADLLDSLADGGYVALVVVDNGSTDGTVDLVLRRPEVRLVRSTNQGYAAGINRGVLEVPDADAYLILNPDLVVAPGAVGKLAAALEDDSVGIVAPLVRGSDGRRQDSLRREPTLPRAMGLNRTGIPFFSEYVSGDGAYREPSDADWALGAALMFRKSCFDALGGWDESFFLYSEETDFCLRARDAGWRTRFVPDAEVVHHEGGSGRSDSTHMMLIVNKVRLYARRHSRVAGYAYLAISVLSELTWIARGHSQSRASVRALVRPGARPSELGCSDSLLPL